MRKRECKLKKVSSDNPEKSLRDTWIWGLHAVAAAVNNPQRCIHKLVATDNALQKLETLAPAPDCEMLGSRAVSALLPTGAVHQGVALLTDPLPWNALEDVATTGKGPLVILDQVSDPRNAGAVFRSAAAFGARAVVMQSRRAPALSGALAKAAAGAIETVSAIRVTNIARSVGMLNDCGWITLALAAGQGQSIADCAGSSSRIAIVLGAEGRGIRPLVVSKCTRSAHIPMRTPDMPSLNVSVAAAIALYCLTPT